MHEAFWNGKLAPVARSANIAWSRDVDEVFGTHRWL